MANEKIVAIDPVITINSVDLSNFIRSLTMTAEIEDVDTTCFKELGRRHSAGLENSSFTMELLHTIDMAQVDGVIWPLRGTLQTFTFKMKDSAVGTDNPLYSGTLLITSWSVGGSVGAEAPVSVTWPVDGVVSRATV